MAKHGTVAMPAGDPALWAAVLDLRRRAAALERTVAALRRQKSARRLR